MNDFFLQTLIAAVVASAPGLEPSTAKPDPEPVLIMPMVTIEREFFISPMNIQPKTSLEKTLNQAGLAKAQGNYEEARLLYIAALKNAEKSVSDDAIKKRMRVLLSCQMAECLFLSGRNKSAEQQYFQSLNASHSIDGPLYATYFSPLMGLGYLYLRSEHYADALEKFKEALDKTIDKRSIQGFKAREGIGLAYAKQNNLPLARDSFEAAVKDIEADLAEEEVYEKGDEEFDGSDRDRATNYANLAYCDYQEGKLENADKNYVEAERLFGKKLATECQTAIAILASHSAVLKRLGRAEDAKKLSERISELKSEPITFVKAFDPNNLMKPEVDAYMSNLQKKIKAQWRPPKKMFSNQLVVRFKVTRDGNIKNLVIIGSSGNTEVDEKGLKAVEAAAPFGPLPSSINKRSINVQFTFDYNIVNDRS